MKRKATKIMCEVEEQQAARVEVQGPKRTAARMSLALCQVNPEERYTGATTYAVNTASGSTNCDGRRLKLTQSNCVEPCCTERLAW